MDGLLLQERSKNIQAALQRSLGSARSWLADRLASKQNTSAEAWQQKLSDAMHLIQANLEFVSVEHSPVTILVTSAEAAEGKTSLAANLAVVAAQAGREVLLVDADLRRPKLHMLFGVRNRGGLTSLLRDRSAAPEGLLQRTRVKRLRLLASGPVPPNPTELLASHRMKACLVQLRQVADLVVIDAPGVLVASDAAVLTGHVDGTILVINAQRTGAHRVSQAVAVLQHAGAHMLGGVLNRAARLATPSYASDTQCEDQALLPLEGVPVGPASDRLSGDRPQPATGSRLA